MAGRASAFAVLGLAPGADADAIEQAYKRLIKQHHPDREGGDGGRAAEINRAYRELRSGSIVAQPLEFHQQGQRRRRSARWPLAVLVAGAALGGLVVATGPSVPVTARFWSSPQAASRQSAVDAAPDPIGGPLHADAIDRGVRDAVRLFARKDEEALTAASRDCGVRFHEQPGTAMLDRCAAFDDAVVGLQDRDPLRDAGPFAPLAVTGRQWSAASELSDDSLAIDGRLDQIRLRVEMVLAPEIPPVAPAARAVPQKSNGD
jgi:hypothetical protein